MGRQRLILALGILMILFLSALVKPDDKLEEINGYFERLRAEFPQEKVHLHFDKPYYSIGDDMWFRAYVVNAEEDHLSPLSKVLYVDLVNDQDSVKKTLTLPIVNGLASGNINLADSVFDTGTYHIRAYTRWMQNFDSGYFFDKQVKIGDALNSGLSATSAFTLKPVNNNDQTLTAEISYLDLNNQAKVLKPVTYDLFYNGKSIYNGKGQTDLSGKIMLEAPVKKSYSSSGLVLNTVIKTDNTHSFNRNFAVAGTGDIDLQFFPEGGDMVNGLRSKVGFKAIGSNGLGIDVEGYIEDQGHNKLIDIKSEHLGMGIFAFAPQAGNKYTAVINLKDGHQKQFSLPEPKNEGYVLALNHVSDTELSLRVAAAGASLTDGKELTLVAQANNVVKYVTRIKMDNPVVSSTILKKYFPNDGMVHFTLFAPGYVPVAERLVFITRNKNLDIEIKTDKPNYTKRQLVNLQVNAANYLQEPVVGAFSVAVTNQNKVNANQDNETTIASDLLLTSDLKGYVEKPNYYFSDLNPNRARDLDILMLTQGWSRFKWEDVKNNKFPVANLKPEQSLTVTGHITTMGNKPMPFAKVTLLAPAVLLMMDTVADANGNFVFEHLDIDEGVKFVVKAKSVKDRNNTKVIMDDLKYVATNKGKIIPVKTEFDQSFVNYLKGAETQFNEMQKYGLMTKSTMLKEVTIKSKQQPAVYNSIVDPSLKANTTITPAQMEGSANLIDQFHGILGVKVMSNKVWGRWPEAVYPVPKEAPMLILLDGQEIKDLTGIVVPALAGVQIYRSGPEADAIGAKFGGGTIAKYGVIVLTTETRVTKYNSKPNYSVSLGSNRGYSTAREFYAPAYKPNDAVKMADLRSTIYWKPDVITGKDGKANLSFYTADEPGTYLVTLEGLDTDGHLARQTFTFEVRL